MIDDTKIITTFSHAGKNLYGDKFISSYLKFWPESVPLTVYKEDWEPNNKNPRITYLDIDQEIPEVNQFRDHCLALISQLPKQTKKSKQVNWYNKAIRWSFKSLVMWKELSFPTKRYIIWLDGDVETVRKPKDNITKVLLNEKTFASQMERIKGQNHCESGIVVFDTQSSEIKQVIEHLKLGYIENQVLTLDKPWDGFWLAKMVEKGISFNDLNKDSAGGSKTFRNRHIAGVLHHNVGNRKLKDNNLHPITGRNPNESW